MIECNCSSLDRPSVQRIHKRIHTAALLCINRASRKLVYTRISASSVSRSCARVPITNTQTLASSLGSGYPSLIELSLRFVDRSIRRKQSVEPSQISRTATSRLVDYGTTDRPFPSSWRDNSIGFPENSIVPADKRTTTPAFFTYRHLSSAVSFD